jgi:tetratricopeptide (TPR) repeat protein
MARAAAKRKPAPRHDDAYRKKHKDSGGQRYEETLFFTRIRKQAKWVFVLLIVAFGLGFVLFGVGSSNLGGLSDIFNGIRGQGGNPSIDKPLKRTQQNPKDAQAWKDLATAYDAKQDFASAIPAWQTYTQLRPSDTTGYQSLAGDLEAQLQTQGAAVTAAGNALQTAQPSSFGPPSTSPLGRALGSTPDPIAQAISTSANTDYSTAYNTFQGTANQLVGVYQKLAKLQPDDTGILLQLAQDAEYAGNTKLEIATYKKFLTLAPDDPSAPQVKAKLKSLQQQQSASSSSSSG